MKLEILNATKSKVGEVELPSQFDEEVRPDLISRAVLALQSSKRKPYGAKTEAGKRHSVKLLKRRRAYRGTYGIGISRTPRKIMSRRGTRMQWVGAFAPNTVGGRRAHPPKVQKKIIKKINKKERKKSIRVGISATVKSQLVKSRGHIIPDNYPFIIDNDFESLKKTKEVKGFLNKFGFGKELERVFNGGHSTIVAGQKNVHAFGC